MPELELTFGPTTNESAITIYIIDNSALEDTEVFHARLSVAAGELGVSLPAPQATVSIQDNDSESKILVERVRKTLLYVSEH